MQERLNELQAKKDEYEAGLWNVNTVLLGGLGKTPLLERKFLMCNKYYLSWQK